MPKDNKIKKPKKAEPKKLDTHTAAYRVAKRWLEDDGVLVEDDNLVFDGVQTDDDGDTWVCARVRIPASALDAEIKNT